MRLLGTKLAANSSHRGFGDQLYDLSGQRPSLDLNFAENKSLVDATTGQNLVTFTRASSGTFVGSDGLVKTATTNEPRFDHNPTTGESLGLLVEEPRTNLVQQSDNFSDVYWVKTDMTITANESTAPDGTLTADLLTNTSASATLNNNITKDTTIRTYTASLWVKSASTSFTMTLDNGGTANRGRAQFNLSTNNIDGVFTQGTFTNTSATLTPFPDGWVRLTLTTTTSTGTTVRFRPFFTTAGATARIWGAQVEEGAFPTSYIPTTTATVTRSADVASITGADFSSWYNQTEGTVFAEFMPRTFSQACGLLSLDDGTTSERLQTRLNTSGNGTFVVADGGSVQANFGTTASASASLNTKAKFATSFAVNLFKASLNGGSVASDTSGTLPTVTQAVIGNAVGASIFNGPLSRITFWPKELSESTLQQITQ